MHSPSYLQPYLQAVQRHGAGFKSLLWASPGSQAARFDALVACCRFHGRVVVDAGCGRADFLDYLLASHVTPAQYIGIEAVEAFAEAARQKRHPCARILHGDFVRRRHLLDQGADVIVFCGSLNTLAPAEFYATLAAAGALAPGQLAFNFLCSHHLAAARHLTWHRIEDVVRFVTPLSRHIIVNSRYLDGDCTICLTR
ncbi:MAG: methyltransferase domain-containing protein [Tepidisphaeraceae bacterium]|jgi:phospholipid N-methyltransferase